jgi:Glyoxalase-like domain
VPTTVLAVTFDCHDPVVIAAFWATALAYEPYKDGAWDRVGDSDAIYLEDPTGVGPTLCFIEVPESKVVKNRVHLDLISDASMDAEVERLTAAGAHAMTTFREAEDATEPWIWTVMQDPEGNEFCVGEPQSRRA